MKKNRTASIKTVIISAIALCLCISFGTAFFIVNENALNKLQSNAIAELERNEGKYDERSIVLQSTSQARAKELAKEFGAELRITSDGRYAALTLPEGTTILDIYKEKDYRKYIDEMSADYKAKISDISEGEAEDVRMPVRPDYSVSDSEFSRQSYLDYLNMENVWSKYTGEGITVAVIDTGIDTDHPEFAGRISKYSYNATEDKIVKDYLVGEEYDWSLIEDEHGHGTSVAGVIASSMNSESIVGIAPNVTLIVIKAACNEDGEFERTSDLVFALYYAIEMDATVVNMSFGITSSVNPFEEATQLAYDSDIICVAAAGNEGRSSFTFPAADPNVIGVGSINDSWALTSYSNYGYNSDIVAPGVAYTTVINGGYGTMTGTSLSSPMVAGAIALYAQSDKYLTFDKVTELLYASCYDLGDLGEDWEYGYGALDVSAFLLEERGNVTFDMLTDELDNIEAVFIKGHPLQLLPEPDRLYAVFDGWYYDDAFTQPVEYYSDAFYSDLTLYAKWVNEEDGIPFTYVTLEDGTVEIRSYTGHRKYITVPEKIDGKTVSSIGDYAFSGEADIREITLPSGIKNIGRYAFASCYNLISIEIPEDTVRIGENAFMGDVRLSSVAFLGDSVTFIGNNAFRNCARLERIEFPSSLESIDGSAFLSTVSLSEISVRSGNRYFSSVDGVLFNVTETTLVAYPAAHGNSYELPEGVTAIGPYAFAYSGISSLDFDGVLSIGQEAFSYSGIKSAVLPESVTEIGNGAFANSALKSVDIKASITFLPEMVFSSTNLETVTIPSYINVIEKNAFLSSALSSVTFEEGSELIEIGDSAFMSTLLTEITIPSSVMTIGNFAFAGSSCFGIPLERVIFEEGSELRVIGSGAFEFTVLLDSIAFPSSLEAIGDRAFFSSAISDVTVPASVTVLGYGAFAYCPNVTSINVEEGNTVYHDINGVVYNLANTELYAYPSGRADASYTPESTTVSIMPWSFAYALNLSEINLPESLVQISEYAFSYCVSLEGIDIPDSVTQIGRYAFANSWSLESVNFGENSSLPRISIYAFAYSGIKSITIPANVSTLAQYAFEGCRNLTTVTFAKNSKLESISAYMFNGCNSITTLVFSEGSSLSSIQAHGFEGMANIKTIDLTNTKLENIDNFAFRFCSSLESVILPDTVTNIGRYAFYACTSLSEFTVPEAVEHVGSYAFLGTNSANIYFLASTLPLYLDEEWDRGIAGYYIGVSSIVTEGDYKYAILTSGGISIIEYLGSSDTVDLSILDLGGDIVTIGGGAFKDSTVKNVILPDTLTIIQAEAFAFSSVENIVIPKSVTFIGREAFSHTSLKTLTFESGLALKVIEQYAFEGTKDLTSVVIPKSVTTMGTGVFSESGLTSVTFEQGTDLTEIPQKAFASTKLESVTLPDSVTLVNHNAFNNVITLKSVAFGNNDGIRLMSNAFYNTGLTSLHIPANVTFIGEYCFVALNDLTEITVDESNPNYKSVDGLLLSKDGRKLITVPAGRTGSLTVPVSVEEIGFGAFEETALSEVTFDENANILSLGYRAFFKAQNLTEIRIPASVVAIDYYAFAYCEKLESVIFAPENNLKGVYEGAFMGDINLKNIVLPDSIVEISDFAFYGCSSITELPISENNEIKGIFDYAFAYTGINGEFTLPATLNDIGERAFLGIKANKITVPDDNKKVLFIELGAFEECNELTEITLPFIGRYYDQVDGFLGHIFGAGAYKANATYVPASLKTVTITDGASLIGIGAFAYCTEIETINVPHSVNMIYQYAFTDVTARYELTNVVTTYIKDLFSWNPISQNGHFGTGITGRVVFADEITEVGGFSNCEYLTGVDLPSKLKTLSHSAFYKCTSLRSIVVPEGTESIEGSAFSGCVNLLNVSLPDGITTIGVWAFSDTAITDLYIPEGIIKIETWAFSGCSQLTRVTLPSTLTNIESEGFKSCTQLIEVHNNSDIALTIGGEDNGGVATYAKLIIDKNGNRTYLDDTTGFERIDTADGFRFIKENEEYKLIAYIGNENDVVLPLEVNGNTYSIQSLNGITHLVIPEGVTEISQSRFRDCTNIRKVTLPASLKVIDDYAFVGCTNLREVVLQEGLEEIGDYAFSSCEKLSTIKLPNTLTTLGISAFGSCYKLTEMSLPNSITSLGSRMFWHSGLTKITFPANITSIPEYFLAGNDITEIVIPEGVTEIGENAFQYCYALKSITLPKSLKTIGSSAFDSCSSLTEIDIPDGVTAIGSYAFTNCENLQSIELSDSLVSIDSQAFNGCKALETIYIPQNVSSIAQNAFSNCEIKSFNIVEDNTYLIVKDGIVYDKDVTRIVYIPSNITNVCVPKTVTDVDFSYNSTIQTVTFEEGSVITELAGNAFYNCTNLKSISFHEGLKELTTFSITSCKNLEAVHLPSTLEKIGYGCFWYCYKLSSIVLPSGLTEIGDEAFLDCTALKEMVIPDSVTSIGKNVFSGCSFDSFVYNSEIHPYVTINGVVYNSDVTKIINIPKNITTYCVPATVTDISNLGSFNLEHITFEKGSKITSVKDIFTKNTKLKSISLPEGVTTVESFKECVNLVSVTLPEGVTEIKGAAFEYCHRLAYINLPEGIKTIGKNAFYFCQNLTSITLPASLTAIETGAFGSCSLYEVTNNSALPISVGAYTYGGVTSSAKKLTDANGTVTYATNVNEFEFIDTVDNFRFIKENGEYKLISYNGFEDTVTLPLTCNGNEYSYYKMSGMVNVIVPKGRKTIDDYAFYQSLSFKSIQIPEGITYIGKSAFGSLTGFAYWYSLLEEIEIPEGVTEIGDNAFGGCRMLSSITIPKSVAVLGEGVVNGCTSLKTLEIPEGLTAISISDCSSLTELNLPSSLQTLTIKNCGSLETITLPSQIQKINIQNCYALTDVSIPNGVTSIYFRNCTALTSVTVPESITVIGSYMFNGCTNLSEINVHSGITEIWHEAFTKTALYNDPDNWIDGVLYVGNHIVEVDPDVTNIVISDSVGAIANNAFQNANKIKHVTISGDHDGTFSNYLTNLETLVITDMPSKPIYEYFGSLSNIPTTLKSIVLTGDAAKVGAINADSFKYIIGVTIYVDALEKDLRWDDNYPGWSNGNLVVYGDRWSTVTFKDADGKIVTTYPRLNSEIIRLPVLELPTDEKYVYELVCWDINDDGKPDSIPATDVVDITATAIIERTDRYYNVTFADRTGDKVYHTVSLPYGATVTLPATPEKRGHDFVSWLGYEEGMTVTSDITIYALWDHHGAGHVYGEPVWVDPTCEEMGYNKHSCTVCDEWYGTDFVPANGHSYETTTVEPTCSEQGYDLYECKNCDHSYTDNYVDSNGHDYDEWETDTDATCHGHGKKHRGCKHCSHKQEGVIPAHGHHFRGSTTRHPTCNVRGEVVYVCEDCGDEVVEVTECTNHKYKKTHGSKHWFDWLHKNVDDFLYGYKDDTPYYYECSDCGHIQTKNESAANGVASVKNVCDHSLGELSILTELGCESPESEGQKCLICEMVIAVNVIEQALGHAYEDTVVPPTTSSEGYTEHVCSECGDSFIDSIIEKLPNIIGDLTGDDSVDNNDVIYLLRHTLFASFFPLNQEADYTNDGVVDNNDVIYLLRHTLFSNLFPLSNSNSSN